MAGERIILYLKLDEERINEYIINKCVINANTYVPKSINNTPYERKNIGRLYRI